MSSNTRVKMVAGAADLMSRRGVNATSMRDVVRHTGTPRGSIGHHFPRGKQQLIEDALVFAGRQVSGPLAHLMQEHGAISGLLDPIVDRADVTLALAALEHENIILKDGDEVAEEQVALLVVDRR